MITSPEELKVLSEQRIVSQKKEPEERKSLSERMREKWHNSVYEPKSGKKPDEQE